MPTVSDIQDVPQSFYKDRARIQEQDKTQKAQDFGNLAKSHAEHAMTGLAPKNIKQPSKFLGQLKNIMTSLKEAVGSKAGPLQDKLSVFFNDFYSAARKGHVEIPTEIQKALLQEATEIDKTGGIFSLLKNAFEEKYGEVYEREQQMKEHLRARPREAFKVAKMLRKAAEELLNRSLAATVDKHVKKLLKANAISPDELGAYKVLPKGDTAFSSILPQQPSSVRLQYDGNVRQEDLMSILSGEKCTHDGEEIAIQPEKMPDGASWGYTGKK